MECNQRHAISLRKNGKVNMRIDWKDTEKNSIVLNSCDYIHLQDNRIANKYPTAFGDKLMKLFSIETLPDGFKELNRTLYRKAI